MSVPDEPVATRIVPLHPGRTGVDAAAILGEIGLAQLAAEVRAAIAAGGGGPGGGNPPSSMAFSGDGSTLTLTLADATEIEAAVPDALRRRAVLELETAGANAAGAAVAGAPARTYRSVTGDFVAAVQLVGGDVNEPWGNVDLFRPTLVLPAGRSVLSVLRMRDGRDMTARFVRDGGDPRRYVYDAALRAGLTIYFISTVESA